MILFLVDSKSKLAAAILVFLALLIIFSRFVIAEVRKPLIWPGNFSQKWSFNFTQSRLKSIIEADLKDKEGEYSVFVKSINNSAEEYAVNEENIFPAGSLYKLFLLAAAFQAIENGEITEDNQVTVSSGHLEEVLGFVDFGYETLGDDSVTYTVSELLERIATISDNYAAVMLAEKLGWDKVRAQVDKIGASKTVIKDPISTTSKDVALFFEKLYLGKVVSPEASQKIIDLLSRSRLNDRIPARLPKGLKIAHKTGELSRIRHDAGIVFLPGKTENEIDPYIIVLMSNSLKYEDDGVETLAKLSEDIYNYLKGP